MYPPQLLMQTLYYRFVAKCVYPIVPRKTPFIGEYINKVGFNVYMHDNRERINGVMQKVARATTKDMLDIVASIEKNGTPEQVAKAQGLKADLNHINTLADKLS